MFDLLQSAPTSAYFGPERRNGGTLGECWLAAMVDEIDYPMLLVVDDEHVLHANRTAVAELDDAAHPLQVRGGRVTTRDPAASGTLALALAGAMQRGLRKMVTLDSPGDSRGVTLAVVPLLALGPDERRAALLVFGKRRVCQSLSLHWFATSHGLSSGERQVVEALCEGLRPADIAERHGVAVSTVRSQIGSARTKTGAASIRDLVQRVAVLPPLLSVLWGGAASGAM